MDNNEIFQVMSEREQLYRLQGRIYRREADRVLLDTLENIEINSNVTEIADGLSYAKSAIKGSKDPLTDFAVDYARIFLGAGIAKDTVAYPYESVYTSRDHLVMQDAYEQVVKIFRINGIGKLDSDLYEDHVALELEFMAILCSRAMELIKDGEEKELEENFDLQKTFLRDHILNWVPEFLDTVEKCPGSNFYKGFSILTRAFLKTEKEFFNL